ncbi:MAG: DUF3147 family protein [Verrucomicrobiales bacterium]
MDSAQFWIKAAVSGLLIALISEISKRSPSFGALIASLPLVSVLAILWMRGEGVETAKIAKHAHDTFWLVLPSLPMFLAFPWMLRSGWNFWLSLGLSVVLTIGLYHFMIKLMARFGWQ